MADDPRRLDFPEPTRRGTLPGQGGVPLAYARWDVESPRGRVVILHGYGEHGGRYSHVAEWLNGSGWSVSTLDQRGFGRSGGVRGDAQGIRRFVEDLAEFLRQERASAVTPHGLPLVLLGHSFGGLVSTLCHLWHPELLDGLILSAPAICLRRPGLLEMLAIEVLMVLAPHHPLHLPGDKARVCSDPEFLARYYEDPHCHAFMSAAFASALIEGERELLPHGQDLRGPLLLLESGQDIHLAPGAADAVWNAMAEPDLERHLFREMKHELLHDLRREEVESCIQAWLSRHFLP